MAILELFDGNTEFSMEDVDKVQQLCKDNLTPGYSIALTDSRGITNNKNIELIVESLITIDPSLLVVLTNQDKITLDFVEIVKGWLSTYNKNLKIGIVIEKIEDFDNFTELFKIEYSKYIMVVLKLVNNDPPMDEVLDKIINLNLDTTIFLDIDHNIKLDYKSIANIIDITTEKRKDYMIFLQLSCGFPLCMFTNEQLGHVFISPLKSFFFFCTSKVIIKPDLTAIHCNLLNKYSINLLEVNNIIEAHYKLDGLRDAEQKSNQYCAINNSCWSYKKLCGGGCLSC